MERAKQANGGWENRACRILQRVCRLDADAAKPLVDITYVRDLAHLTVGNVIDVAFNLLAHHLIHDIRTLRAYSVGCCALLFCMAVIVAIRHRVEASC
jgi:hypothetical protein